MTQEQPSGQPRWSPIIDTHAHLFERGLPLTDNATYDPKYSFTEHDYLKILDEESVPFGVVTAPSFLGTYNDYALNVLRGNRRLRGTAIVDPETDPQSLRAMADTGIVGIRYSLRRYPDLPDFSLPPYQRLLRRVRDLDWYVHILAESDRLAGLLPELDKAGVKLVIDHFGVPEQRHGENDPGLQAVLRLMQNGRTWVKVSAPYRLAGMDTRVLARKFLAAGGPERLLWGSDCPWTAHEGQFTYRDTIRWFEECVPDPGDRETMGRAGLALNKFI